MHIAWDSPVFYLTLCLYGIALYNCYIILGNRLTPGAAIAWILVNLGVPFVGVPLYFLVGQNRLSGYVKRFRRRAREYLDEAGTVIDAKSPDSSVVHPSLASTYQSFKEVFSKFGPVFDPQYGHVDLLVDGKSTFDAIFEAINKSQHYILIQYYILRSDRLGLELKELLVKKAKEGIPVFLLYDDMGSFWLKRDYIRDLRNAGVKVERFLPLANFRRFFQMNFRNHRKLVVVDGHWAFTGGLNVGEEYALRRYKAKKNLQRYWRDTHIRLTGPTVKAMEEIFLEDWYFATEEKIEPKSPPPDYNQIRQAVTAPDARKAASDDAEYPTVVQIVPSGPTDGTLVSIMLFLHLIQSAKKRLWLATPYLIPDPTLVRALELAVLRGVDVKIIIPDESDHRFVQWVTISFAEQLQALGVEILLYKKGFMHQKVVLMDHGLSAVGTMNLDSRALYLNFETVVLIHSYDFNQQMEAMMLNDFTSCRYLPKETTAFVRHLTKLRDNIVRLLGPLL